MAPRAPGDPDNPGQPWDSVGCQPFPLMAFPAPGPGTTGLSSAERGEGRPPLSAAPGERWTVGGCGRWSRAGYAKEQKSL